MMQNSLDRVIDGMVVSMRQAVLPNLTDPYARAQVETAIDLMLNLAERVEWRGDQLAEVVERVRPVLAAAHELAPEAEELDLVRAVLAQAPPPAGDNEALVAAREAHLRALAQVQEWSVELMGREPAAERLRDELDEVVLWTQESEYARLKRARDRLRRLSAS